MSKTLLEIQNLRLEFRTNRRSLPTLDGVSLTLDVGETLGLVGESGSGKTLTALSIARLLPEPSANYTTGSILLEGCDVLKMSARELRAIRGGTVSYIFQEPSTALNPVLRIGCQIKESLRIHQPRSATDAEVIRLLKLVGVASPEARLKSYPHEMSGGMQQRAVIAMALASRPKLLIADEPTTALDATIQAQIIELLRNLKQQFRMAILLITHNLGVVSDLADRIAVMYSGKIVEESNALDLLQRPLHPYTKALINSIPHVGAKPSRLTAIPGAIPQLNELPAGCSFHPRCGVAVADCSSHHPEFLQVEPDRWVRCPNWAADSPLKNQPTGFPP